MSSKNMLQRKNTKIMKTDAELSSCRTYRYALWRIWDENKPYAMFVGLNPSTADENDDDPTIKRCISFSNDWGYGGLCMTNLFAYRATDPLVMFMADDPIGGENDVWITKLGEQAGLIVAAWGNGGSYLGRSNLVKSLLPRLHYLKLNITGEPAHPLYLRKNSIPLLFQG